jgi:hypothetical protein
MPATAPGNAAFEGIVRWLEAGADALLNRWEALSIDIILIAGEDGEAILHLHDKTVSRCDVPRALEYAVVDLTHPDLGFEADPRRTPAVQASSPLARKVLSALLDGLSPMRMRAGLY